MFAVRSASDTLPRSAAISMPARSQQQAERLLAWTAEGVDDERQELVAAVAAALRKFRHLVHAPRAAVAEPAARAAPCKIRLRCRVHYRDVAHEHAIWHDDERVAAVAAFGAVPAARTRSAPQLAELRLPGPTLGLRGWLHGTHKIQQRYRGVTMVAPLARPDGLFPSDGLSHAGAGSYA